MYKIIIVEDESIIRDALINVIPWEDENIKLLADFSNGTEALEFLNNNAVDIVLTDIKMPGINGLELIEKTLYHKKTIRFIIFSGYDDFQFAKRAMSFGVQEYILKPFSDSEIINALRRTIKQIQQSETVKMLPKYQMIWTHYQETFLLFSLLSLNNKKKFNNFSSRKEIFQHADFKNVLKTHDELMPFQNKYIITSIDFENHFSKEKNNSIANRIDKFNEILAKIVENLNSAQVLFTIKSSRKSLSIIAFENFEDCKLFIQEITHEKLYDICIKYSSFEKLFDIYSQIENNAFGDFKYLHPNQPQIIVDEVFRKTRIVSFNDISALIQKDFSIVLEKQSSDTIPNFLLNFARRIILSSPEIYKLLSSAKEDRVLKDIMFILECNSFKEAEEQIRYLLSIVQNATFHPKPIIYKDYIEQIIKITEQRIDEPQLSLKYICTNFLYMNEDYVSRQFTQETGKRYSHFMNEIRIKKAKEILLSTDLQVGEIAHLVGLGHNPQYFSHVFRKSTGFTPSEFRKEFFK